MKVDSEEKLRPGRLAVVGEPRPGEVAEGSSVTIQPQSAGDCASIVVLVSASGHEKNPPSAQRAVGQSEGSATSPCFSQAASCASTAFGVSAP